MKTGEMIERLRKINPYVMLSFLAELLEVVRPVEVTKEEIKAALEHYKAPHLRDLREILEQVLR